MLNYQTPDPSLNAMGMALRAVERQKRMDVPSLAQRLPGIFRNADCEDFNADMFNDWLLAKDLSHHFHADGTFLRW